MNSQSIKYINAADEHDIDAFNRRVIYAQTAIAITGSLACLLDAINPMDFGFSRYAVPQIIRWYGYDAVSPVMWMGFCTVMLSMYDYQKKINDENLSPRGKAIWRSFPEVLAVGGLGAAALAEYRQTFLPGRSFDWMDMGAYTLGYGLCYAAMIGTRAWAFNRLKRDIDSRNPAP